MKQRLTLHGTVIPSRSYMLRMLLAAVFLFVCAAVQAQTFTLKGTVTDDEGNALELATVSCLEQQRVVMTNLKGEYKMTLQTADSVVVRFSMVGYKARTRTLYHPQGTQTLRILMRADQVRAFVRPADQYRTPAHDEPDRDQGFFRA